jgi:hypothetical protein
VIIATALEMANHVLGAGLGYVVIVKHVPQVASLS